MPVGPVSITPYLPLVDWIMQQPDTQEWMYYKRLDEKNAARSIVTMIRPMVDIVGQWTNYPLEQTVREIIGEQGRVLYGFCDRYHIAHDEMGKWIKRFVDTAPPDKTDPKKWKTWRQFNNILDYYGKTGELSYRLGKSTKSRITYVDQSPWFDLAKYRFRLQSVHSSVIPVQATPAQPRPNLTGEHYGFISSLDMPIQVTDEWMEWIYDHLHTYGFMATCATLPCKGDKENPGPFQKVAVLSKIGFIYQLLPE